MTGDLSRRTPSGRTLRLVTPEMTTEDLDEASPVERALAATGVDPDALRESVVLPVERRSVATGRHWVVRTAAERGVTGMANQVVELLSSELLANAVLHGPDEGAIGVEVIADGTTLRVSVTDRSPLNPVVLQHEPSAPNGRGMAIVEAMSSRWGVEEQGTGKTVWFELDLDDF